MKIKIEMEIEMDDDQLRAMEIVRTKGASKAKIEKNNAISFWGTYLMHAIEQARIMNINEAWAIDASFNPKSKGTQDLN